MTSRVARRMRHRIYETEYLAGAGAGLVGGLVYDNVKKMSRRHTSKATTMADLRSEGYRNSPRCEASRCVETSGPALGPWRQRALTAGHAQGSASWYR
jgi:hypothetical protein